MKQEILNSKKQILDKMASMQTFKAIWSEGQKSNQFKLMMESTLKSKTMAKGVLTEIDKQWIADLITTSITTAIKPLQVDIQILKADVKAIKECPTIKKELK